MANSVKSLNSALLHFFFIVVCVAGELFRYYVFGSFNALCGDRVENS